MNIQNFFRPVVKLVDSDCEVDGECSSGDEAFQNIYQPTESDKEFIASDDEDNDDEKQRFLDFMKDEEDARRWRQHCAKNKEVDAMEKKKIDSPAEKAASKKVAPKKVPKPKPYFIRPPEPSKSITITHGSIPTFLIRTRKRRKPKKRLPLLVQHKKRKRNDASSSTTKLLYHPPTKKKGRQRKGRTKRPPRPYTSPGPYKPFDMDEDPYFVKDFYSKKKTSFLSSEEEEDVLAVSKNFCLIKTD